MDGFHMFLYVFMLFYRTYHERCGFYRQRKGTPNSFLGSRHCFQKTEPADHKSVNRFELHLCLTGIWLLALDMRKLPVSFKYFHKGILYVYYMCILSNSIDWHHRVCFHRQIVIYLSVYHFWYLYIQYIIYSIIYIWYVQQRHGRLVKSWTGVWTGWCSSGTTWGWCEPGILRAGWIHIGSPDSPREFISIYIIYVK